MSDADEDDLYAAMDWLLARQDTVQKKLASRHLSEDGLVLYDLSSSYFEGSTCPLAKLGYSRDGKRATLQVNYGLLTDARGCPVAVSVFDGNTADSKTFMPAVQRVREDFGLKHVVMVGDRGMISQEAIDELREMDAMGWITALKSTSIRALLEQGQLQLRAHIFLCMLAYYVEWHMRQAWRELMFAETEQGIKATRDPVAPARRSASAQAKASSHTLDDGAPAHSFATLMADLATIVRNTCRTPHAGPHAPSFTVTTSPTQTQQRAFDLIQQIKV